MRCKPRSLERFECRVHLNTERWGPQIIVIHTGVKIISRCLSVSRCVHEGSFSLRTRFSGPLSFDTSVLWEDPSDKGNLFLMIKWGHKWFDRSFSHFHNIKVWLKWLMVIVLHHGGSFLVVCFSSCFWIALPVCVEPLAHYVMPSTSQLSHMIIILFFPEPPPGCRSNTCKFRAAAFPARSAGGQCHSGISRTIGPGFFRPCRSCWRSHSTRQHAHSAVTPSAKSALLPTTNQCPLWNGRAFVQALGLNARDINVCHVAHFHSGPVTELCITPFWYDAPNPWRVMATGSTVSDERRLEKEHRYRREGHNYIPLKVKNRSNF